MNTMIYLYYQKERKGKNMDNKRLELAKRICDCILDGYDDEEIGLYTELRDATDFMKRLLERMCEEIEDLKW